MLSQVGTLLKPFPTHGAGISAVTTMHAQDVSLDVAVSSEELEADTTRMLVSNFAQLTHVGVFIVLLVLMSLQHDPSFDSFVTSVTLVGRI